MIFWSPPQPASFGFIDTFWSSGTNTPMHRRRSSEIDPRRAEMNPARAVRAKSSRSAAAIAASCTEACLTNHRLRREELRQSFWGAAKPRYLVAFFGARAPTTLAEVPHSVHDVALRSLAIPGLQRPDRDDSTRLFPALPPGGCVEQDAIRGLWCTEAAKDSDATCLSVFYPRCSQPRCWRATLHRRNARNWRIALVDKIASWQGKRARSDTGGAIRPRQLVRMHWRHKPDRDRTRTGEGECRLMGGGTHMTPVYDVYIWFDACLCKCARRSRPPSCCLNLTWHRRRPPDLREGRALDRLGDKCRFWGRETHPTTMPRER